MLAKLFISFLFKRHNLFIFVGFSDILSSLILRHDFIHFRQPKHTLNTLNVNVCPYHFANKNQSFSDP